MAYFSVVSTKEYEAAERERKKERKRAREWGRGGEREKKQSTAKIE